MPTPRLNSDQINELRKHADAYLKAHKDGGYASNSIDMREFNVHRFIDFLEGKYDPATEKGRR
ncbi:hypothetical protein [Salinispora arenicola]|uniref:hypothetical protein n=1 Tax=Salinispora arenicola TaxID=168697 RepID=UPI0012F8BAD9|nr:hypothetical protein [Salinispora arenicola]